MADALKLGSLQNIVIAIVVIGIVLGVGMVVLREIGLNANLNTESVYNETLFPATDGTFVVNNMSTTDCYSGFTVLRVTNVSVGYIVQPANYTTTEDGRVYNLTSTLVTNSSSELLLGSMGWNVTYTYQHGADQTCQAVEQAQSALLQVPTWLSIIVIILIVGIILAVVFAVLPRNGERGGNFSRGGGGVKMGGKTLFGGSGGDSGGTAEL